MKRSICAGVVLVSLWYTVVSEAQQPKPGFGIREDTESSTLDVILDGRRVGRYMYAWDTSTKESRHRTYKPFLHVFDAEGEETITKGAGGRFTHHRGIFIGWNKLKIGGKSYDRWHMKGGEQVHQRFIQTDVSQKEATVNSLVHWHDSEKRPLIEEQRTMVFSKAPDPGYVMIDFTSVLKAVAGDIMLDGDPEHAGVQFRPANEVVDAETVYVFPKDGADPRKDHDYPWVGETFTLRGKKYSVVHMNHPANPKGTRYSAYRNYGRFGAFFTGPIKAAEALTVKYRFLITAGEMPEAGAIQACWDEFAGVTNVPSAVPSLTVRKAAPMSAPKKKAKKADTPKK